MYLPNQILRIRNYDYFVFIYFQVKFIIINYNYYKNIVIKMKLIEINFKFNNRKIIFFDC